MAAVLAVLAALVLAAAAAAGARPPMDADMAELAAAVRAACVAESGVDEALLARVDAGADLGAVAVGGGGAALKCYVKCTMETAGMLSEGRVDVEAVLALLPDAMRDKNAASLRACGTKLGADLCDTAYLTQLCWQAANRDDYFLI